MFIWSNFGIIGHLSKKFKQIEIVVVSGVYRMILLCSVSVLRVLVCVQKERSPALKMPLKELNGYMRFVVERLKEKVWHGNVSAVNMFL